MDVFSKNIPCGSLFFGQFCTVMQGAVQRFVSSIGNIEKAM